MPGPADTLDLRWSPVADAVAYRVLRRTAASPWATAGQIAAPVFSDGGLAGGESYGYAIRALGSEGVGAVGPTGSGAAP